MTKTILVTGGAGYIGSHTCKALARAGFVPVTYDNLSRGHRELVKWGPFEPGDILDNDCLIAALRKHRPAAVIHFAAFAYVGESVEKPEMYHRNNVEGTRSLLGCMREAGVNTIVFSSSCATYGIPQSLPITETHPQNPVNPYGLTKLTCERMIKDDAALGGLRYAILRYFNAAGADPEGETGEYHDPETHLIPLALAAARGTTGPLMVYGDDYPTEDGTCVRDYVHVTDLANAHVAALNRLFDTGESVGCNIGTGRGYSVKDILRVVAEVTGKQVPHVIAPRREGDPPTLVADTALAAQVLGWHAQHSGLDEIIATAAGGRRGI